MSEPLLNSERATFSAPSKVMRAAQAKADAKRQKFSTYVAELVERDLRGDAPDPASGRIIEELLRGLRPDLVSDIQPRIAKLNQPTVLARMLEALLMLVSREANPADRLYLITMREAAALAMGAATRQHEELTKLAVAIAPDIGELIEEGRVIALGEYEPNPKQQPPAAPEREGFLAMKKILTTALHQARKGKV